MGSSADSVEFEANFHAYTASLERINKIRDEYLCLRTCLDEPLHEDNLEKNDRVIDYRIRRPLPTHLHTRMEVSR